MTAWPKTPVPGATLTHPKFEWDGWTMVKETTGSVVTRYIAPQGQIHSFERGGQVYQVHSDAHNGSVRAITDASGAIVAHYEFDAWGAQLASSSPFSGGFSYGYVGSLGVRTDEATGLLYMRHRWYDSSLSRFISRDPLRAKSNRYKYAYDNPCSYIDPSGLQPPDSVMDKRVGINLPPQAYPPPPTPEQVVDGLIIGASIVFEPVDWVMTGYDAATEGFSWWMAAGLIPIGSYAAFKRIQKWFDLDINVKLTHDDIPPCPSAADNLSPFVRQPGAEQLVPWPKEIYRGGGRTPSNLRPRLQKGETGVSFRDSLSNPVHEDILGNKEYIRVDTSKLPPGSVFLDGGLPPNAVGHVNVYAPEAVIQNAATKFKFPR